MSILDAIGDTPLVDVDGVLLKCEHREPSGSVKARLARYVVDRAEAAGLLAPGDTLVDSSGAHLVAARAWLRDHPGATVVSFCSDEGEKYLSSPDLHGVAA